jgi:DNA mismatch repair protein MutL
MSSKIRVLTEHTINKIAAGEVIENPASVVKELVENALDAGSTEICIEIQAGGRQLIRISDNGCGMSSDDALLCLERHATSKISDVDDIENIFTMGFRGEAIPSIASISKFTLLTCPQKEEGKNHSGTLVMVDGGRILSTAPAARSPGTTIEVKSLFFNVPVRRKFQKSPAYDTQEILKIVSTLALGYPSVQFELVSDHKSLLRTPTLPSKQSFQELLGKRIDTILGKDFSQHLTPLSFNMNPFDLVGYIGLPSYNKSNKTGQYLFINQRAVYSPMFASAIREGFGTMLPTNRYPAFVLHLRLPGSLVDVNVHPQKKEVRIRQEHFLKESLIQAVQTALRRQSSPSVEIEQKENHLSTTYSSLLAPFKSTFPPPKNPELEGDWEYRSSTPPPAENIPLQTSPSMTTKPSMMPQTPSLVVRPKTSLEHQESLLSFAQPKCLGRVSMTLVDYIVLDPQSLEPDFFARWIQNKEGGLCLIDQKAAYSRIYYEKLLGKSNKVASQALLLPITLQFSSIESSLLKRQLDLLNEMGFSIREFGDNTFLVDALPDIIKKEDLETCIHALVDDLIEQQHTRHLQIKREEQLALAACRASIPKMKRLGVAEAQALINQLFECQLPWQCPMGKSTILYLSPETIAHHFK